MSQVGVGLGPSRRGRSRGGEELRRPEGARAMEGGSASVGCQKAPIANEMEDGAATSTTAAAKTTRLRTGQRGIRDAAPRRST